MVEHEDLVAEARELPSDFWQRLSPVDFERQTSTIAQTPRPEQAFAAFVGEYLESAEDRYRAHGDAMDAVAVLENATVRRVYMPDWDETNRMYCNRLRREAVAFGAVRFAIADVSRSLIGRSIDLTVPGALEAVLARDDLVKVINWYAEDTTLDQVAFGNIRLRGGEPGPRSRGANLRSASPLYRQVLGAGRGA